MGSTVLGDHVPLLGLVWAAGPVGVAVVVAAGPLGGEPVGALGAGG
jgi:hypothetical protein